MAGGYGTPAGDSVDALGRIVKDIVRRLRELERPTGTSLTSLVAQVQAALANIVAQVDAAATDWMTANAYTKTQIDDRIASTPGDVQVNGDHTVTGGQSVAGDATVGGSFTAAGLLTADAGVSSADVRSRVLTSSYAVQYVDGSGRMGTVPSAARFKQDISPHAIDPTAIRDVQIVTFRYKAAVEEMGADAPAQVGVIADQIDTIPALRPFVQHDENGAISGVDYGQMVVPLIATVQDLMARVEALES